MEILWNFLENSISFGLSLREQSNPDCQQALERVLASEGQSIVNNLVLSLTGELQAYSIDAGTGSIAGILWKLRSLAPGMMAQWITVALANAPERPRQEFVGVMNGELPRKDFNVAVRGFMNACKREKRFARQ